MAIPIIRALMRKLPPIMIVFLPKSKIINSLILHLRRKIELVVPIRLDIPKNEVAILGLNSPFFNIVVE